MSNKRRLVLGVGTNDADYPVTVNAVIGGKSRQLWMCPFYRAWRGVLTRCYSAEEHAKHPTYIGCSVAPEWHTFSSFRGWMVGQDHESGSLDKDLLVPGNKVYSPDTCVFIPGALNKFLTDSGATRGEWPIGVCWNKQNNKFSALCNSPFSRKQEYLGYFHCPNQAHLAWATRKLKHATALAAQQTDPRVAKALIDRFTAKYEAALDTLTTGA